MGKRYEFNIAQGRRFDLNSLDSPYCYRCQSYAPGLNEDNSAGHPQAWLHYNFMRSVDSTRFVPKESPVSVTYYGYNPVAVFVETDTLFRRVALDVKRPICYSESYLETKEIITFQLKEPVKLFDLMTEFSFGRHNLKLNHDVINSTNMETSSIFAEEVYQAGYDGIIYPTRQSIKNAVVLFDRAREAIAGGTIIDRQSVLSMLRTYPDPFETLLGIKILDGY